MEGNEAYLTATGRLRDSLVDRDVFEAFPDNPDDPQADGVANLSYSFEKTMRAKSRDVMPLQRYDVQDILGQWRVKYWKPANWPVFDEGRLVALVHHVLDVAEQALAQSTGPKAGNLDLIDRADLALDVARRQHAWVSRDLARIRDGYHAWMRKRRDRPH